LAIPVDNRERHIVPRWHRAGKAAILREIAPLSPGERPLSSEDLRLLSERRLDWETHPTLPFASDFVGTALVLGKHEEAREAAAFILGRHAATGVRLLADRALHPQPGVASVEDDLDMDVVDPVAFRQRIRALRAALRRGPRNPLAWSDLAYEHALSGEIPKALHAMDVAVGLAPRSRYLLRSAARLYVQAEDPERALRLLRGTEGASHEPWLIAAELAVSAVAGRTPKLVRAGRQVLGSGSVAPAHTTELASALGTLECLAGKTRVGKRLFQDSLVEPTENAVAQAVWASRKMSLGIPVASHLDVPGSFEARARDSLNAGAFDAALNQGRLWLRDQLFSRDPASFCSYVASVTLADYGEAVRLVRLGRLANPNDWLLLNNLAFAEASRGNISAAQEALAKIRPETANRVQAATVGATWGLVRFRLGELEEGRRLYKETIDYFTRVNYAQGAALAALFLLREESLARVGPEILARASQRATQLAERAGTPDVKALLAGIHRTARPGPA
jgi:tetratricopeptide (TPR) repeat protein